jgi:alginate O-acetyltransferase complex protein AlgJ
MSSAAGPIDRVPGAKAIVALFLVAIVTPGLGLALGVDRRVVSESEMRELAPWPAWSWQRDEIVGWPAKFRQYFEDHFALRARLIDARSRLLWSWMGASPSDTVIAGRGDWLFYADDGALRDWVQAEPFPPEELEDWRQTLVARRAFLARRGIPFLFVIAADKQMVYPEYMPEHLRRMRDDYRADQLIAYLRRTAPDFPILDVRPSLLAAKSAELLYHRYDTHWNDRGALVAYQAIVRELQRWLPGITPLRREDFHTDPAVPSGDKTAMLGLIDPGKQAMPGLVLRGGARHRVIAPARPDAYGEDPLLIVEHDDQSLPSALVFRDSFGARLIPYLSEHFRHVEYYWQNELDYEEIERQRPDVVIQEFVARHFFTYGPYRPLIPE